MFFLYITFSLILSVSGGVLLHKHENLLGGALLAIGILSLIYTIIYYSRKNKRTKNGDNDWCIYLDCFDCVDGDVLNCGHAHGHDCGGFDPGHLDCGGFDCGH